MERPPKTFICASAIGYYGDRGDEILDEQSPAGESFLADVCRDWEEAALEAAKLGMRVVMLRFGIILSPAGGALAKMLPPFKLGAGGRLGSGNQCMNWVSVDDAVGAINHVLFKKDLSGPINVVAPEPSTNEDFSKTLGKVLRRPVISPMPRFLVRALFGEMGDEMLLASTRAQPSVLQNAGFYFHDTNLKNCLSRLLGKEKLA
jgi:uncharacterized protein (TIGR01777 family)